MSAQEPKHTSGSQDTIPYQEYLLRVLFSSFQPAVKLGLELNYPLDTIKEMMTLALWKEAKAKHSNRTTTNNTNLTIKEKQDCS